MAETVVYDGQRRVAAAQNGKGLRVPTSTGIFSLMPGVLEGHAISGYDRVRNIPVQDRVGPDQPMVTVGAVVFEYSQPEPATKRIIDKVLSLLPQPKPQASSAQDASSVPLY